MKVLNIRDDICIINMSPSVPTGTLDVLLLGIGEERKNMLNIGSIAFAIGSIIGYLFVILIVGYGVWWLYKRFKKK